jgi:hypothetical protein
MDIEVAGDYAVLSTILTDDGVWEHLLSMSLALRSWKSVRTADCKISASLRRYWREACPAEKSPRFDAHSLNRSSSWSSASEPTNVRPLALRALKRTKVREPTLSSASGDCSSISHWAVLQLSRASLLRTAVPSELVDSISSRLSATAEAWH